MLCRSFAVTGVLLDIFTVYSTCSQVKEREHVGRRGAHLYEAPCTLTRRKPKGKHVNTLCELWSAGEGGIHPLKRLEISLYMRYVTEAQGGDFLYKASSQRGLRLKGKSAGSHGSSVFSHSLQWEEIHKNIKSTVKLPATCFGSSVHDVLSRSLNSI